MDVILAAIGSTNHLVSIGKAIFSAHDKIKHAELQIEFQGALLDLQSKQTELASSYRVLSDEKDALKKQLDDIDRWNAESNIYELQEIEPEIYVYGVKPEHSATALKHYLCVACFAERRKSILQRQSKGSRNLLCHNNKDHQITTGENGTVSFSVRRRPDRFIM